MEYGTGETEEREAGRQDGGTHDRIQKAESGIGVPKESRKT